LELHDGDRQDGPADEARAFGALEGDPESMFLYGTSFGNIGGAAVITCEVVRSPGDR